MGDRGASPAPWRSVSLEGTVIYPGLDFLSKDSSWESRRLGLFSKCQRCKSEGKKASLFIMAGLGVLKSIHKPGVHLLRGENYLRGDVWGEFSEPGVAMCAHTYPHVKSVHILNGSCPDIYWCWGNVHHLFPGMPVICLYNNVLSKAMIYPSYGCIFPPFLFRMQPKSTVSPPSGIWCHLGGKPHGDMQKINEAGNRDPH